MRAIDVDVPYAWGDTVTLYNVGDFHRGAKLHMEELLKRDIETIRRDPNARWVCTGDVTDAIFPGDKRFRVHGVAPEYLSDLENMPRQCVDDLARLLEPIADKCDGIVTGNHDETVAGRHFYHAPRALADRLGVPYLGGRGFVRYRFRRGRHTSTVVLHVTHGSGGGGSAGAAANYLEKQMANVEADVHFCGHFHRKAVVSKQLVVCPAASSKATVGKARRIAVATGSYLDQYAENEQDYAEDKGMAAWEPGMLGVSFSPETCDFKVVGA